MTSSLKSVASLVWLTSVFLKFVCAAPVGFDWINSEETKRCRGMPCEKWDAIQTKLAALREKSKSPNDTETAVFLVGSRQDMIDGDIWPTMEIVEALEEKFRTRHKRKLTVFNDETQPWQFPVHYYIDADFTNSQADSIRGAIAHWESQTCVRFKEEDFYGATLRQIFAEPFLYFIKSDQCGTFVGHYNGIIAQQVRLNDECVYQWGAIVHEIGHNMGFWHEHQRSDRDAYVTVHYDRLYTAQKAEQYLIRETRNLVPYDYGSVMHYWAWAHSLSFDAITLEPKDLRYLYTIGQKTGLSYLDAKLANLAYCSDKCNKTISCSNNGYQDPNDCNKCKCPDGFAGDHCETLEPPQKAQCGGLVVLGKEGTNQTTYITSPGYYENETYEDYTSCTWMIQAPENYIVNLMIMNEESDHFSMFCVYAVCFHWIEVKTALDKSLTGPRYCCTSLGKLDALPDILKSEGRHMMLLMRANFSSVREGTDANKKGFRVRVWTSPEGVDAPHIPSPEVTTKPTTLHTYEQVQTDGSPRLNLVFVMDSSGSVGAANWIKIKEFAKRVIYDLDRTELDYRLGFVTFGSTGYVNLHLGRHSDPSSVTSRIDSLPWKMESSNIADGIRKARNEIASGGGPEAVPSLVVLVTDGPASAEEANTDTEADILKSMPGAHLAVIGLTNKVDESHIRKMASSPPDKFARVYDSFDGLNDVVHHVTDVAKELGRLGDAPVTPQKSTTITSATTRTTTRTTTPTTKRTTRSTRRTTTTEPTAWSTTTPSTHSVHGAFLWRCNFEDEKNPFCDMEQEKDRDQFDWTRQSGPTQSSDTGPAGAAEGKYYIYIEASRPRRPNDKATIYIPEVPRDGEYCLRYSYNMFGYHIRELQVNIIEPKGKTILLQSKTKLGDVGSTIWMEDSLGIYLKKDSKIGFTGVRGIEYSGDIALDNLSLRSGRCI